MVNIFFNNCTFSDLYRRPYVCAVAYSGAPERCESHFKRGRETQRSGRIVVVRITTSVHMAKVAGAVANR